MLEEQMPYSLITAFHKNMFIEDWKLENHPKLLGIKFHSREKGELKVNKFSF